MKATGLFHEKAFKKFLALIEKLSSCHGDNETIVNEVIDLVIRNTALMEECKAKARCAFWDSQLEKCRLIKEKKIFLKKQNDVHSFDLLAGTKYFNSFVLAHKNGDEKKAKFYFHEAIKFGNISAWWYQQKLNEEYLDKVNEKYLDNVIAYDKGNEYIRQVCDFMTMYNAFFINTPGYLLFSATYLAAAKFFSKHKKSEAVSQYLQLSMKRFRLAKSHAKKSQAAIFNFSCGRGISYLLQLFTDKKCSNWEETEEYLKTLSSSFNLKEDSDRDLVKQREEPMKKNL